MHEADEMNVYAVSQFDAPFDVTDLEWLYRYQDVDGSSLYSRLAFLAPISFLNPLDGLRHRRMFALDTFDTTTFSWSPDNPGYGAALRHSPERYIGHTFRTILEQLDV